ERNVGDGVLDDEARAGFAFGNLAPRAAVNLDCPVTLFGYLISPVAERAFGELHDVALVDNRHAFAFVRDGIEHGGMHQADRPEIADRLDADANIHHRRTDRRAEG